MNRMSNEVHEIIDEAQTLMVEKLVKSGAFADIADAEETIYVLTLGTEALEVTGGIIDGMYDKMDKIEGVVTFTEEQQKYLRGSLEELNEKITKLMKKLDELNTNKED